MVTLEEDVEAQALRARGWSVSAIARHFGRDRKAIRQYLSGEVVPGRRRSAAADPFEPFVGYRRHRPRPALGADRDGPANDEPRTAIGLLLGVVESPARTGVGPARQGLRPPTR
jgi:hypothetical protein